MQLQAPRGVSSVKIDQIVRELYAQRPTTVLYHYTSLGALQEIVESRQLHATDVHFFNDAAEFKHTVHLLQLAMAQSPGKEGVTTRLHEQFKNWLRNRLTMGHTVFVSCFTANGNLLSQWRSYCDRVKGISLGFLPEYLSRSAVNQSFHLAGCIYDAVRQTQIAAAVLHAVEELAADMGESRDLHPSNSFHTVFEAVEGHLLRIAALLKYPAFEEEEEWRAVSPTVTNYVETPIEYREGHSTLVPYVRFSLPTNPNEALELQHVFVGPTPHINNAVTSVSNYLSKAHASPRVGVTYCGIPYTTW
jgi:Protein of unknown function (DUF2971)